MKSTAPRTAWAISVDNIRTPTKRRTPKALPKSSKVRVTEQEFMKSSQAASESIGAEVFRIICQKIFIDPRLARPGLVRVGGLVSENEADLAAQTVVEIERVLSHMWLKYLADRTIRKFILDSAFDARQRKLRKKSDGSKLLQEAAREFPEDTVKQLLARLEGDGQIEKCHGGYVVAATGEPLPKQNSLPSLVTRARKNLTNR